MDIDQISEEIEKLTEKINFLNYPFVDMDLRAQGIEALDAAVSQLEIYLDFVNKDSDENH